MLNKRVFTAILAMLLSACSVFQPSNSHHLGWRDAGTVRHAVCPSGKPYQAGRHCYAEPFDTVTFPANEATLGPVARRLIGRQAAWLAAHPADKIKIDGFVDAHEMADADSAFALGMRRAQAVKDYLVALDIDPDRIITDSIENPNPAPASQGEKELALNRRSVSSLVEH